MIWLTNSIESNEELNEMKYYHHIENDLNIVYWKHIYHEYSFHSWMEHLNIIWKESNILDRMRLAVFKNDSSPVVNVDRLGRSTYYTNIN